MIYPFLQMRIKGVTWYQGEANEGDATDYACQFPAMINDWRSKFVIPDLSFHFVQLAPWSPGDGASGLFPGLRWAQTAALTQANSGPVGMAVAADSGDPGSPYGSIHPRSKQIVGWRVASSVGATVYGLNIPYKGASVVGVSANTTNGPAIQTVVLIFDSAKLEFRGTAYCDECCSNPTTAWYFYDPNTKSNVDATATIINGDTISISAYCSTAPTQLYYAWYDYPECMLYNEHDFPTPEIFMPL